MGRLKYTIELTEEQLKGLAYACRVTDRLIIGQLDYSLQECCEAAYERLCKEKGMEDVIGTDEWYNMRHEVERHIDELRRLCWGQPRNSMHGIRYSNYADMLFDMQKVIEHALWLERPDSEKSHITNDAFPHTHAYGGEPLIKVEPCRK